MPPPPITTRFDKPCKLHKIEARDLGSVQHNLAWYGKHGSPDRKRVLRRENELGVSGFRGFGCLRLVV